MLVFSTLSCSEQEQSVVQKNASTSPQTIVISLPADVVKLDPPQPQDGNSLLVIYHLYDRLVDFANDDEIRIVPGLAKSWETSDDGLRVTFHLRDDATFSDGTPVTSEAVRYTFERLRDPNHPEHFGISWTDSILGDWFDHFEVPDDRTIVFVLNRPYVPLLANLAIAAASIVNPDHVRSVGREQIATDPMGSGPYVLDEWKTGNYVRLRARDSHWRGRAKNDVLIFRTQKDMNQRMAALKRGDIHIAPVLSPSVVSDITENSEYTVDKVPVPALQYIVFNMDKEVVQPRNLRLALNYAVNREVLCDGLLEGSAMPAHGIIPPGMLGYREKREFGFSYAPEYASKLIAEAGLEGTRITMHCFGEARPYNIAGTRTAQRLQEDFRRVGIEVELVQMDFGGFLETVNQRTVHEMALIGWMSDNGDPDNFINELFGIPGNRANYENPEANALMKQAQSETDDQKRAELYQKAEDLILQDPPCVVINHAYRLKGYSKKLHGYNVQNIMMDQLWDVSIEP